MSRFVALRSGVYVHCVVAGLLAVASVMSSRAPAATYHKADNTNNIASAASWTEGIVPTNGDTLLWDSTVTGANTVSGSNGAFLGYIQIQNPGGPVSISVNSNGTFTWGKGLATSLVDMSSATQDLNLNGSGFFRVASAQYSPTFTIGNGRTLTFNMKLNNQGNSKVAIFNGGGNVVINSDSGGGGAMSFNVDGATVTMNNSTSSWGLPVGVTTSGTVSSGTLVIGNGTVLNTKALTVAAANGLAFGSGVTSAEFAGLSASGGFSLTNSASSAVTLTIGNNNTNYSLSGAISGAGSLIKVGSGTQTISGSNAFTGGLTVNAGALVFGHSSAAANGLVTAANGTTLSLANSSSVFLSGTVAPTGDGATVLLTSANASAGFGTTFSGSFGQTLTIGGATQVNAAASSQQFSGFGGTVSVASGALLRFSASTLNNGGTNATFDLTGNVTTRNNGTLTLGALQGAGNMSMGGSGPSSATLDVYVGNKNIDTTYSGVMSDADAVNGKVLKLFKVGNGKLTLTGTSTYTGSTTVSSGTLAVSGGLATSSVSVAGGVFNALVADLLPNTASLSVSSGKYQLGGDDTVNTFTITGGELAGTGYTLTASTYNLNGGTVSANLGAGTVNIGGTVQITGTTSVSGTASVTTGELVVDSLMNGSVSVATGAQLGGTGTINGNVSFSQNALFTFNAAAPLTVTGSVSFTNPADFGVNDIIGLSSSTAEGTYTLIAGLVDTSGLANLGSANAYSLGGGKSAYFQQGSLQLVVVPEPSALAVVGGAIAVGGIGRLSRRRCFPAARKAGG